MKKLCLTLVALCMAALAVCGAEPLLSLVPEGSCGVLSLDMDALWRHPRVAETLRKPEIVGMLAEWETRVGCKLSDIEEVLVFTDNAPDESNYIGGLIRSRAAAKLFAAAANPDTIGEVNRKAGKSDDKGIRNRTEKIGGREVVFFSDSAKPADDDIGLVAFTPEVLLVARRDMLPKMINAPRLSRTALDRILRSRLPGRFPVWGGWYDPNGKTVEVQPGAEAPKVEDKIIGVGFAFGFAGREQLDQRIVARLRCNTRNFASTLGMMIPGYAQMGAAMAFQKKPELGTELLGNFRCNARDFDVDMSLFLPKELLDKLEAFISDANVLAKPDPVPRDIESK